MAACQVWVWLWLAFAAAAARAFALGGSGSGGRSGVAAARAGAAATASARRGGLWLAPPPATDPVAEQDVEFTELLDEARETRESGVSSSPSAQDQLKELQRMSSESDLGLAGLGGALSKFRSSVKQGIEKFQGGDLDGAMLEFDLAMSFNSSQPLIQRGITLYCLGRYEEAASQLRRDVERVESSKTYKASDLRIWLSACLNRLGKAKAAKDALDLNSYSSEGNMLESNFLMKNMLLFFGREKSLEDLMELVGDTGGEKTKDVAGLLFYGNFYLGLFYHSIGETDMARFFFQIPAESTKYASKDMWFHLPKILLKRSEEAARS